MPVPTPPTGHEHHASIRAGIDRVPALADMLEQQPLPGAFRPAFDALVDLIEDTLLPHIELVESGVYQELARMLPEVSSVAPLRREDVELTDLARALASYRSTLASGSLGLPEAMALRRAMYRLYALVKVHLAEEELYLRVIDGRATAPEQQAVARGMEHVFAP
ncbi:hypothetical protein BH23CHL8_BH23CHL8_02670 [soil metagenome]